MSSHSLDNTNYVTTNTSSSSFSSSSIGEQTERFQRETHEAGTYSSTCCYNASKLSPPFDSAMVLTVLVLLIALFFMGFLSFYIRRFADQNSLDPARFRRRSRTAATEMEGVEVKVKGVDPTVVGSLPAYVYNSGDVEEGGERECPICLGGFEESEWVKEIPYCCHVFHAVCIDTWLSGHVTCPLCRTAVFFPLLQEKGMSGGGHGNNQAVGLPLEHPLL